MMPNINDIYKSQSKWLATDDLKGREVKLVIDRTVEEEVGGEKKLVTHFVGKEKGLVLNKTNARRIASAYGEDSEDWDDKEVILYPDKTDYQGKEVDCIRVRVPTAIALDDEIPF